MLNGDAVLTVGFIIALPPMPAQCYAIRQVGYKRFHYVPAAERTEAEGETLRADLSAGRWGVKV